MLLIILILCIIHTELINLALCILLFGLLACVAIYGSVIQHINNTQSYIIIDSTSTYNIDIVLNSDDIILAKQLQNYNIKPIYIQKKYLKILKKPTFLTYPFYIKVPERIKWEVYKDNNNSLKIKG